MKMIPAGTAAANQYPSYVDNCQRAVCALPYTAPLPSVSALQLYVDFGDTEPASFEFTFVDHCNNSTEQIFPTQYTVGQTPEGGWYGVFRDFTTPSGSFTSFVVHLSTGTNSYFSQMFSTEPCGPLMKIKSCHPEGATDTGFDINGIYYGLPQGAFLGTGIRYWHIAYVRHGKVREMNDKATFKSNLYNNFRTTVEKVHQIQTEITPKWYKNVLLAIYSRGVVQIDEGQIYLVSDLAFEALNDDDFDWKPWAQVKETFRLFYGCDDARCESCCNPTLISVQINEQPPVSVSSEAPSEPPLTGCLRVIFDISGVDGTPWAIGGLMCDGHNLSMESIVGTGIEPLPLCVQFDSLTGITPPVSIIFTEPCPNDCVIYRNPSTTDNTTGITYRDCAGVWHEDITLAPLEEICARRSWVIGPTTGVAGPGSGTLVEVGFCGSFPDESEGPSGSGGSGSGGSGGGSESPAACCDPTLITATTETTIPDGSLPGDGSDSVAPTCCAPFILSVTNETIDSSGSGSGSGSIPPEDTDGIMMLFSAEAYPSFAALTLSDWNTNYQTGINADTPFDEIVLLPDHLKIVLKGATNLNMSNTWEESLDIKGFWDNSGSVITAAGSFLDAANLETVEMFFTTDLVGGVFAGCTGLTSVGLPIATSVGSVCFQGCTALVNISLPATVTIGNNCFQGCTALEDIGLPSCTDLGGTTGDNNVFQGITGNTITLTIPTATATDGDVVTLQANNTVTLILV